MLPVGDLSGSRPGYKPGYVTVYKGTSLRRPDGTYEFRNVVDEGWIIMQESQA